MLPVFGAPGPPDKTGVDPATTSGYIWIRLPANEGRNSAAPRKSRLGRP